MAGAARAVIPLGATGTGVDGQQIRRADLIQGRYGIGVWRSDRQTLLIAETVPEWQLAAVARHILDEHAPELRDDSWQLTRCEAQSCPQAQAWTVEAAAEAVASSLA